MQDRDYQINAENAVLSEYDKGMRRVLISMATGTGKTVVMSRLWEKLKSRLPGQLIVLAHREELIDQNRAKMQAVNPSLKVDKEMAEHRADPSIADVIMASVATLGRKGTKRVEAYNWERVDKIFTDEAHHSTADSYRNVYNYAGILLPQSHKLLLGLTATPNRGDGSGLSEVYQKIAFVYSLRQAIEEGWLVDVRGYKVKTDTDISAVKTSSGDFQQEALEEAVNTPRRNLQTVMAWEGCDCRARQTVAFCVGIKHAKDLADMFEQRGHTAAAIWGGDPDRAEKLRLHREGKIRVLCNCSVLTEGYDDWRISCILLARPTKSPVLFAQMVGRGTRLQDGTGNLKDGLASKVDCVVLDVVDNAGKNSLVTLPTLMGLGAGLGLMGRSLVSVVQQIEDLQEKHPSVDFSKLDSVDNIKALIESVNMFDVRFPEEVEENSDLMWFRAAGGGYKINIPKANPNHKNGFVRIQQNLLDKWEIVGRIADENFHGTRGSFEEAIKVSDEQIRQRAGKMSVSKVNRTASWNDKPASKEQMALIKKLFPWKTVPEKLTKGQASRIIGEKLAGKGKK
ncbi:MAG: hypothetical protein C5B59_06675 [Bacteroidetes bacterium]|nr:MAG: hypothetical protein C5B59_06675 [Bacteroidota bacterium]